VKNLPVACGSLLAMARKADHLSAQDHVVAGGISGQPAGARDGRQTRKRLHAGDKQRWMPEVAAARPAAKGAPARDGSARRSVA
jgi:hypothetical protein